MTPTNRSKNIKDANPALSVFWRRWGLIHRAKPGARVHRLHEADYIHHCKKSGKTAARDLSGAFRSAQALHPWVHQQTMRARDLRATFSNHFSGHIYCTENFFENGNTIPEGTILKHVDDTDMPQSIENSIVLFNNNSLSGKNLERYIALYRNSPTSLFVIWDFDNHHWLDLSCALAAFCDVYIPAHADNLSLLSYYHHAVSSPINTGVTQWTRAFLREQRQVIFDTPRSNQPLGGHIDWRQFPGRTRILNTLSNFYPKVRAVTGAYHRHSDLERLQEWSGHKAHWVVPVLTDLPIRTFDALITGGVPIVPKALRRNAHMQALRDHVYFYDLEDIEQPETITEAANRHFDEKGIEGIKERHEIALNAHHLEHRLASIFSTVYEEFRLSEGTHRTEGSKAHASSPTPRAPR